MEELLADEFPFLPCQLDERDDLVGDALLLLQREGDRLPRVAEVRLRCLDSPDVDGLVGVEQELHHHHRVVPLLDRLAVEMGGELRQRLGVVVHRDRHVLLRRGVLVRDLLVERLGEAGHRRDSRGSDVLQTE